MPNFKIVFKFIPEVNDNVNAEKEDLLTPRLVAKAESYTSQVAHGVSAYLRFF